MLSGKPVTKLSYKEYMEAPEWKALRSQAIRRDDGKCQNCGTQSHLNVHHHTYPGTPGSGQWHLDCLDNLTTLCETCHEEEHNRLRAEERERSDAAMAAKLKKLQLEYRVAFFIAIVLLALVFLWEIWGRL